MAEAVLITGARAAAALDLARDFVRAGWDVHLADSVCCRMARWSAIPATHHTYPAPRQHRAAFQAAIADLVEQHAITLIVPTCEEVFHLSAPDLKGHLGDRLFSPALDNLRVLHDKLAFSRFAISAGLNPPESHPIEAAQDNIRYLENSAQWVFKPRYSRFGGETLVAPERAKLEELNILQKDKWMVQRRVHGDEVCMHFVAHRGSLVGFAAYQSQWRLGGGASYAFEPVASDIHENLHEMALALTSTGELHGQFGCDAIVDDQGNIHVIECNPRATSGVHLLTGGHGLVAAIAKGQPMHQPPPAPAYLGPAMLVFGLPFAAMSGRLFAWRKLLGSGRDAISQTGDRLPFAGALVDAAAFSIKALRHNISTNEATTLDIEWNGEELNA